MIRPLLILLILATHALCAGNARQTAAAAMVLTDSEEQVKLVKTLQEAGPEAAEVIRQWKEGEVYLYEASGGVKRAVTLKGEKDAEDKQALENYADGKPVLDATGAPVRAAAADLEVVETDSLLRGTMKEVTDLLKFADPLPEKRARAVADVGLNQELDKLPVLKALAATEKNSRVKRVIEEAVALTELKAPEASTQVAACEALGRLGSIPAQDALKTLRAEAVAAGKLEVATAVDAALSKIAGHVKFVNTGGTLFRGLSLGSVLLVVAIGLAITFGLMGVINMAHGELIAVGAYTTYVLQNVFANGLELSPFGLAFRIPGMGLTGTSASLYFVAALPCSFLVAAAVGIVLERTIIRFLYSRPLESLLATWGVSLVLQQLFRLTFGANNVQVDSPAWLAGNWTVNDVILGWNRVFVIVFAVLIVGGTSLVLRKTPLGLLIRAVMQNRSMAACMGVRTERVNMMTFGFGSGLAGLAGAFLSQIGNVGPGLGQSYIIDSFMTVVVGGVGSLAGAIVSALGIGIADQSLQQILGNPVLGKILVLGGIILFLQWRPSGLFVTRSRNLES